MEKAKSILSEITTHMKYARFIEDKNRRETWSEIVQRNMDMHKQRFPELTEEIDAMYQFVLDKKVLPSMRSMQFAGKAIQFNPARIFNCSYMPIDSLASFSEAMFLLLSGVGVGFSVQSRHTTQLPVIRQPKSTTKKRFLIEDSIEGWADSVKYLFKCYTGSHNQAPEFDFSSIREKGALLVTSGGKAPGSEPLKVCLKKIEAILSSVQNGQKLSTLQCHDLMCIIADAVLAGGIRRAALISLFDYDDEDMLTCKSGEWWVKAEHRGRANNSAVLKRGEITKPQFLSIWRKIQDSGSGEPGTYWTNNYDWGTNPCVEIALKPFQFCNLVEINVATVTSEQDFQERVSAATKIATLQASYTDFHYLRPIWRETTEQDALLGVSMTGIASGNIEKYGIDLSFASSLSRITNQIFAKKIGVNAAARITCVKPAGTTSLVLGTSSGIHSYHSKFYIRRLRVKKNEPIYIYLANNHPELVKDEYFNPSETAVIEVPQFSGRDAVTREKETAIDFLNRIKTISESWVKYGHIEGDNTHNVSATVSIKEQEWTDVGEWMWENRELYNGLSVLPFDGGTYIQAPFEDITEERYNELISSLSDIDLSLIKEFEDKTDLQAEAACAGGACEI